jgi:hypothetical protein
MVAEATNEILAKGWSDVGEDNRCSTSLLQKIERMVRRHHNPMAAIGLGHVGTMAFGIGASAGCRCLHLAAFQRTICTAGTSIHCFFCPADMLEPRETDRWYGESTRNVTEPAGTVRCAAIAAWPARAVAKPAMAAATRVRFSIAISLGSPGHPMIRRGCAPRVHIG